MLSGMTNAIQARDLRRTFGDNEAVAGIDLDVEYGEIYGFLGPNGAGKSTTVKMLCTLLGITSGAATVAGFDVDTQPGDIRLRIGVALQDSSIDGKQTGRELLQLQGRLYGLNSADIGGMTGKKGAAMVECFASGTAYSRPPGAANAQAVS